MAGPGHGRFCRATLEVPQQIKEGLDLFQEDAATVVHVCEALDRRAAVTANNLLKPY